MAGEWVQHEVSHLIDEGKLVIGDGYRARNSELARQGLPFARAGNINNGFDFAGADRFPEENLPRVGNKVSQPYDVVFTSKGTVGRFAFVKPLTPPFIYSPQLCFWRALDAHLIDPGFLYYWMHGREFYLQVRGVAGQTDMAEYVSLTLGYSPRRKHCFCGVFEGLAPVCAGLPGDFGHEPPTPSLTLGGRHVPSSPPEGSTYAGTGRALDRGEPRAG